MARRRVPAGTAAHLAAMAAVTVGVALTVADGWSPEPAHLDLDSGLLVSTRTEFQACAEVGAGVRAGRDAVLTSLRAGLDQVRRHQGWEAAGLGAGRPELTAGCPSPELPGRVDEPRSATRHAHDGHAPDGHAHDDHGHADPGHGGAGHVHPGAVPAEQPEPSPYRLWIYVLDDATADRVLGRGVPAARSPAEYLPAGPGRAAEVSTAVLVREGHLTDPAFVGGALTEAAGLAGHQDGAQPDGTK